MTDQSPAPPVFIGGSGSSGSTLLRIILDRHPEVACGPEISVFNKEKFLNGFNPDGRRFRKWLRSGLRTGGYYFYYPFFIHRRAYGLSEELLLRWQQEAPDVKAFLDRFMGYYLEDKRENIFAEKTPSNAYTFPELLRLYPEARFVHIFRDGRDVICSLRRRGFNWFQASSLWLYNTAAALRLRGHPRYFELSYEELVTDTETAVAALCGFLQIDFDRRMLVPEEERLEVREEIRPAWRSSPAGGISSASVGRHRKELSRSGSIIFSQTILTEEAAKRLGIEPAGTAEIMEQLGYPVDPATEPVPFPGYMQQYYDWTYRTLKSLKRFEKPDPPLTRLVSPNAN